MFFFSIRMVHVKTLGINGGGEEGKRGREGERKREGRGEEKRNVGIVFT